MPAEAIHLSAWADTQLSASTYVRSATSTPVLAEAARAGALLVDLPYFESFHVAVWKYLRKQPQRPSRWGDMTHNLRPIELALKLGEAGVQLSRARATADAGQYLVALALGYISHAAVDTNMHPWINELAHQRAASLHSTHGQQHHELEKFQSILFHEQRLGFDFMGTLRLYRYIGVDFSPLHQPGLIAQTVQAALRANKGEAPELAQLQNWVRGYGSYVLLLSSPLGKTIAPPAAKQQNRADTFETVDFPARFAEAVAQSKRWVQTLADYLQSSAFDEPSRAHFFSYIPEGTIDPDALRSSGSG